MKKNKFTLSQQIDRFMAGETSVAEEQALFAAFAPGRGVPPELEMWREQMQWYASLAPAAPARRRPRAVRFAAWATAAASVAMLVTVAAGYIRQVHALPDDYVAYAGSYVIRNGVKTTDLAAILPEIKRVEHIVSRQQSEAAKAVEAGSARAVVDYDGIDMDDPEVRRVIERVLSSN